MMKCKQKTSTIYKAICIENNKIYIGQTSIGLEGRKKQHLEETRRKRRNYPFYIDVQNYGQDKFEWEILFFSNVYNASLMDELEEYYIKLYKSMAGPGYINPFLSAIREIQLKHPTGLPV